jgi:hypothetical protein
VPLCSVFVLDGFTLWVKLKNRTKQDCMFPAPPRPGLWQEKRALTAAITQSSWTSTRPGKMHADRNHSPNQAVDCARQEHPGEKNPALPPAGAFLFRVCPSCSAEKKWDCYIRSIHLDAAGSFIHLTPHAPP